MTKKSRTLLLSSLLCAMVGFAAPARADIAPNPGGQTVVTNSTSEVITVGTPVVTRVDDYATTLVTFLNGGLLSTQNFGLAFSDPTVQGAVSSADSILTGDGATFGAPIQDSLITALFSTVTTPPPTYPCPDYATAVAADPPPYTTPGWVETTTTTFGPATINVGTCGADTFTVLAGQGDINLNFEIDALVTGTETDTYLTTAIYEIDGLTQQGPGGPVSVPEAGTIGMLAAGLGGLAMLRRRRRSKRTL